MQRKYWPSSDHRLDTTQSRFMSAAIKQTTFQNIAKMPIVLEFYTCPVQTPSSDEVLAEIGPEGIYPHSLTSEDKALIASHSPDFFTFYNQQSTYWNFRRLLHRTSPHQLIGRYLTGSNCRNTATVLYPRDTIDCHDIAPLGQGGLHSPPGKDDLLDADCKCGRWYVNPTDSRDITRYQDQLLVEAATGHTDFVFFDNMHRLSLPEPGSALDVGFCQAFIAHMTAISTRLQEVSIGSVFNLGTIPYWSNYSNDPAQLHGLRESFLESMTRHSGIYLEAPFRYRDEESGPGNLSKDEFDTLRSILDVDALVVIAPYPHNYDSLSGALWAAALAMVLRNQGDALFVATSDDLEDAAKPWHDWPSRYGRPLGAPTFEYAADGRSWQATRHFHSGRVIRVMHMHLPWNFASSTSAELPLPFSLEPNVTYTTLAGCGPIRGSWDGTHYSTVNPKFGEKKDNDRYSDCFILAADLSNGVYSHLVAVDITFGT